jgi:hypothetical protein
MPETPGGCWSARRRKRCRLPKTADRQGQMPLLIHQITLTYPYQGAMFGGVSWIAYSYAFIRIAVILARRADGKPVKLLYDESNFSCGGDEDGTYICKVGAKKDGTITAYDWHVIGSTNGAMEKTHAFLTPRPPSVGFHNRICCCWSWSPLLPAQ